MSESSSRVTLGSPAGRWILAASVLGSGAVFLEGTVVAVAFPTIGRDFHLGVAGLQWVMNGYLLTLSALMLLGGALGDRLSRPRVFAAGLVAFAVGSGLCAVAPNPLLLIAARVVQGAAGALVVPNSLALLETTFTGEERGAAIGQWAAWSGISTAAGPLLGGWLVDYGSWRLVFVSVIPLAAFSAWVAFRHAISSPSGGRASKAPLDYAGTVLVTLSLAAIVASLIAGPASRFSSPLVLTGLAAGIILMTAFIVVESRAKKPILPLDAFRSRQFVGANVNTLLVYAALSGLFFLLMLHLQDGLGYGALKSGACLLPINFLLLVISPWAGRMAERIGTRLPMAIGSFIAAGGMLLFGRVKPGATYLGAVLPAVVVFGIGLSLLVAPLTAVALRSLGEKRGGLASGVNNAAARVAGLLGTAVLPGAAGLGTAHEISGAVLSAGFFRGMLISSALCAAGGLAALLMIDGKKPGRA